MNSTERPEGRIIQQIVTPKNAGEPRIKMVVITEDFLRKIQNELVSMRSMIAHVTPPLLMESYGGRWVEAINHPFYRSCEHLLIRIEEILGVPPERSILTARMMAAKAAEAENQQS